MSNNLTNPTPDNKLPCPIIYDAEMRMQAKEKLKNSPEMLLWRKEYQFELKHIDSLEKLANAIKTIKITGFPVPLSIDIDDTSLQDNSLNFTVEDINGLFGSKIIGFATYHNYISLTLITGVTLQYGWIFLGFIFMTPVVVRFLSSPTFQAFLFWSAGVLIAIGVAIAGGIHTRNKIIEAIRYKLMLN